MGKIIKKLAQRSCSSRSIFSNRFCIEIAEKVHIHYRNIRLLLNLPDFLELCKGCVAALDRWNKQEQPEPRPGIHIELCRRKVATDAMNAGIQVNLNENLYNLNKGKVFAEGADFDESQYIHLKIKDVRIELSLTEFKEVSDAIAEAQGVLKDCNPRASVPQN